MLRDGADDADRLRSMANCGCFRQKGSALQGGLGNAIANANRETIREARRALGRTLAAAAEEHGKAMSLATAAEYALMLTDLGPPRSAHQPVPVYQIGPSGSSVQVTGKEVPGEWFP